MGWGRSTIIFVEKEYIEMIQHSYLDRGGYSSLFIYLLFFICYPITKHRSMFEFMRVV